MRVKKAGGKVYGADFTAAERKAFARRNQLPEEPHGPESAAAKGQLWACISGVWMRLPTSTTLLPPSKSAMKNSPMLGTKVSTTPERSPGSVRLRDTVRKAFMGAAPRSRAASTKEKPSDSALEYTANII